MRLQRLLAQAGFGSRRQCEELITEGRVQVDGQIVDTLGVRVHVEKQKVMVDGVRVKPIRLQYFAVNKPPGVVSTCSDPAGRMRVIDLINTDQRVYNVGRLDKSSEGLILVTNDGDLADRLTHPRYGVEKTYSVTVAGRPHVEELRSLEGGVYLAEGLAKVSSVRIRKRRKQSTDLQMVLTEGRNREIRRLLAKLGHKVTRLQRVAIGPLHLDGLPVGGHRRLDHAEVEALKRATEFGSQAKRGRKPATKRSRVTSVHALEKNIQQRKESASTKRKSKSSRDSAGRSSSSEAKKKREGKRTTVGARAGRASGIGKPGKRSKVTSSAKRTASSAKRNASRASQNNRSRKNNRPR